MTNTEALIILNKCRDMGFERTTYTIEEYHTARDMAIKALEQEPCEDDISRQAVKDIVCKEFVNPQDGEQEWRTAVNDAVEEILHKVEQLPSVAIPNKTGHWINRGKVGEVLPFYMRYECSECGECADKSNYCPNCGSPMEIKR